MFKANVTVVLAGIVCFSSASDADWISGFYEPKHNIEKEYINPASNTEKEQLCVMRCEVDLLKCNTSNSEKISTCQSQAEAVLNNSSAQMQQQTDPVAQLANLAAYAVGAFGLASQCEKIGEDCESVYDSCFTSCGGVIKEKKTCTENCEVEKVINSFEKISDDHKIVISYIKQYLGDYSSIHISPNISPNKIDGYVKGMSSLADKNDILLALIDNTVFGGASEGIALFKDYLIHKNMFLDPVKIYYDSINHEVYQKLKDTKKGKKPEPYVIVKDYEIFILSEDANDMADFLNYMRKIKRHEKSEDEVVKIPSLNNFSSAERIAVDAINTYFKGRSGFHSFPGESVEKVYKHLKISYALIGENDSLLAIVGNNVFGEGFNGFALFGEYFLYRDSAGYTDKIYYKHIKGNVTKKISYSGDGNAKSKLVINERDFLDFNHQDELLNFLNHMIKS